MLESLGGQVGGLEASWRHLGGSWRLLEALGGILEALGGILEDLGGILEALGRILEDFGRILEAKMEAPTRVKWQGGGLWKENLSESGQELGLLSLEHAHPCLRQGAADLTALPRYSAPVGIYNWAALERLIFL